MVRTGPATKYGKLGRLIVGVPTHPTPIEEAIVQLARQLVVVVAVAWIGVVALGIARSEPLQDASLSGARLVIAPILKEPPSSSYSSSPATLGGWQRRNALIWRLGAVEIPNGTIAACRDKYGAATTGQVWVPSVAGVAGNGTASSTAAAIRKYHGACS